MKNPGRCGTPGTDKKPETDWQDGEVTFFAPGTITNRPHEIVSAQR
ncbi:MAG: hypothetical protein ACOX5R_10760 [bacterium]